MPFPVHLRPHKKRFHTGGPRPWRRPGGPPPPASSLLNQLAGYWKLDEASGVRADSLGVSPLTDNNTVTQAAGKVGFAAQCVAANTEYLSAPSNPSLMVGDMDFTVALWVWLDTLGANRWIAHKSNGVAGARDWELFCATTNIPRFQIVNAASVVKTAVWSAALTAGAWFYVVGWHDSVADTVNIQVNNGTPVSLATAAQPPTAGAADFRLSAPVQSGVNPWDGRLDECGYWSRVLTAAERTSLYNAGAGLTYPFA